MGVVGEQRLEPLLLFVGEQVDAGVQGAAGPVERIVRAAAVAVDDLLDPAAAPVEGVAGEADDVERVHHRDSVGQLLGGGGLEPGEAVHRDDLDPVAPGRVAFGEPSLECLFGTALDHVEQPGWAGVVTDRGEVDDHGDVLVTAAGVPPDVLIDAYHGDAVEPVRVVDQGALAFGEDGVVRGVPRDPEPVGDPGDGEVLHHQGFQRPPQSAAGQLRPRLRGPAGVLAPHMPTLAAAVAAHGDVQAGRSPAERLVRQPADHGAAGDALAAAAVAPVVGVDDPAREHGTIRVEALPGHDEPELVQAAEHGQVGAAEAGIRGSVVHRRGLPDGSV